MLALVSATVVAVGWVADRALDGQISRARADALAAATETARLSALSVRATLAAVEQRVLTQTAPAGVLTERLPTTATFARSAFRCFAGVSSTRRTIRSGRDR